ncbi:MAG: enoyl-CoA hydratase/isomerase family protein [Deltaproteobacteria bacterium]|nr:enoyl-CoA hydratase/isomerase family protein [Deltaproteobacteria bacterium]
MTLLHMEIDRCIATVTLNRPEKRNALSKALVQQLTALTAACAKNPAVRVMVLQGNGPVFCAGADIEWMRSAQQLDHETNLADAQLIARLMATLAHFPKPLLIRAQGAAIGAGAGLVATADIVVAAEETQFGFAEVRLGIIPSVVAPYVIPKIGASQSRRYFLTSERVDARTAERLGLVHTVVPASHLDATIAQYTAQILSGGPEAIAASKAMILHNTPAIPQRRIDEMIEQLAEIRVTPEAQEGLSAFLEKRAPQWYRNG